MVAPTVEVGWELVEGGGSFSAWPDTDIRYPISFSYGFTNTNPSQPMVAAPGMANVFMDNSSSDLTYTIQDTDFSTRTGKRLGVNWRVNVTYDTMTHNFIGRTDRWQPVPGLVDERVTLVELRDYMGQLSDYTLNGVTVQAGVKANEALDDVASSAPLDVMPYSPASFNYSSNGETFTRVFHDLQDNTGKCIQAFNRIAGSELGHIYTYANILYYKTHQDWINLGATSIGTLDNRFIDLETVSDRDMEYAPIYVGFTPSEVSDSVEVLFTSNRIVDIKPGEVTSLRVNYRDPDNSDVRLAAVDTDITTPVDGTDYLVSYTDGDTDNAASSDLAVGFTNKGSSGEFEFTNGNVGKYLYLSLLQVRGKPIRIYDKETVFSESSITTQNALSVTLPYIDDREFAEDVLEFYTDIFSQAETKNLAKSYSFIATADSDVMQIAMDGKLGTSVEIKEDVSLIDGHYRIMNVAWDIYGPNNIQVTWDLYPETYTAMTLCDSDENCFCDSNGIPFAFWR